VESLILTRTRQRYSWNALLVRAGTLFSSNRVRHLFGAKQVGSVAPFTALSFSLKERQPLLSPLDLNRTMGLYVPMKRRSGLFLRSGAFVRCAQSLSLPHEYGSVPP
jgi:hypothetical protein